MVQANGGDDCVGDSSGSSFRQSPFGRGGKKEKMDKEKGWSEPNGFTSLGS